MDKLNILFIHSPFRLMATYIKWCAICQEENQNYIKTAIQNTTKKKKNAFVSLFLPLVFITGIAIKGNLFLYTVFRKKNGYLEIMFVIYEG